LLPLLHLSFAAISPLSGGMAMGDWSLSDKVGIFRMQKVATQPSVIGTLKCDKSATTPDLGFAPGHKV
ncbi:MAG: hypothetical protein WCY67_10745, partial [Acidithiobacillus sp.]